MRSLAVMRPSSVPSASTSGSFLILRSRHHALGFVERDRPGVHDEPVERRHALGHASRRPATNRTSRCGQQTLAAVAAPSTTASVPTPVCSIIAQRLGDRRGRRAIVCGSAMTPCCVRLTIATSRDLRRDVAGAEAAIDDADAAFFGQDDRHGRARDRVHVGRDDRPLQRDVLGKARRQIDGRGIARSARRRSCGVKRKSSNVQPRTKSSRSMPTSCGRCSIRSSDADPVVERPLQTDGGGLYGENEEMRAPGVHLPGPGRR